MLGLLGGLCGGVAFLPFVGDAEVTTLDDGDPSNDLLAAPLIGNSDQPNVFSDNGEVDIYELDWHAGEHLDVGARQFVRQSNGAGTARGEQGPYHGEFARTGSVWCVSQMLLAMPLQGRWWRYAMLVVTVPACSTSLSRGVAPSDPDPARPQGLFDGEPGGPRPTWPRFTEFVISERGQREVLTPHQITVRSAAGMGRVRYSWDAVDNDPLDFRIVNGRYQKALVVVNKRLLPSAWSPIPYRLSVRQLQAFRARMYERENCLQNVSTTAEDSRGLERTPRESKTGPRQHILRNL